MYVYMSKRGLLKWTLYSSFLSSSLSANSRVCSHEVGTWVTPDKTWTVGEGLWATAARNQQYTTWDGAQLSGEVKGHQSPGNHWCWAGRLFSLQLNPCSKDRSILFTIRLSALIFRRMTETVLEANIRKPRHHSLPYRKKALYSNQPLTLSCKFLLSQTAKAHLLRERSRHLHTCVVGRMLLPCHSRWSLNRLLVILLWHSLSMIFNRSGCIAL